MIYFIIIIVVLFFWLLWSSSKSKTLEPTLKQEEKIVTGLDETKEDLFEDEYGQYKIVTKKIETPRKTFVLGKLRGKYWGEIDFEKEEQFLHTKFYDFNIYEAELSDVKLSSDSFPFEPDAFFPKERLPEILPLIIKGDNEEYAARIHEPQTNNISFSKKLHQTDGHEVFGTIEANFTGYILDFLVETHQEKEYLNSSATTSNDETKSDEGPTKTTVPTGKIEYKESYLRKEYYYSDYKSTYWDNWKYHAPTKVKYSEGCLSSSLGIIALAIGIIFLLLILPRIAILLPFIILPLLFRIIPQNGWIWLFRILGILFLIGFVAAIVNSISHVNTRYIPKPIVQDNPQEIKPQLTPIADTSSNIKRLDTLITHYRIWHDYYGETYECIYSIKQSDYKASHYYKEALTIPENSSYNYDQIIYNIKEHDKNLLNNLYHSFDSLKSTRKLTESRFAEMIVSFVQDIPYSVVLPDACDPNIYSDNFIRNYLTKSDALCDGYEKFGINTPVEFLASLKGDCDTRTLLLYSILSHYGYDVALLSSEYYNHSIIGINLPYNGIAYTYRNQKYILWETTSANIKPGLLPDEISNMNYWRISLKSK